MIRDVVRKIRSSRAYLEAIWWPDAIAAGITNTVYRSAKTHHVLLSASGGGNIGDQAMLETYLQKAEGPICVVTASKTSLIIPDSDSDRVEVCEIPNLLSGLPVLRIPASLMFAKVLARARSYSVIGADIMDGVYSPEQSVSRLSTLNMARYMNVRARILGFSWSPKATRTTQIAMRRIENSTLILARDPQSYRRLVQDGVSNVTATFDTVFCLSGEAEVASIESWVIRERALGRKIAIVNVSGLIASKVDLTEDYLRLIKYLWESDHSVLFLPHVIRSGDDDLAATEELIKNFSGPIQNAMVVRSVMRPLEVKRIASIVDVVVTGRMHLAVLTLSSGIPALTLGTQGKVEGLYESFGAAELCIKPISGFSDECIKIIQKLQGSYLTKNIVNSLSSIKQASAKNFTDLGLS